MLVSLAIFVIKLPVTSDILSEHDPNPDPYLKLLRIPVHSSVDSDITVPKITGSRLGLSNDK